MLKLGDNAWLCTIGSGVHNRSLVVEYVPEPPRTRCTIESGLHNIQMCHNHQMVCHLQRILLRLALLAYIDTLVVQAKRRHNKTVVHPQNTRDQRPLAVMNKKVGAMDRLEPSRRNGEGCAATHRVATRTLISWSRG